MINMKSIIEVYDWLNEQPGETPKRHADVLEKLIFEDLIFREKILQNHGRTQSSSTQ
ncbi:hypothetical protein [Polynucleobacter sp. AP-Reno-20A-A9]|uniref:hypothetical protein n=1 Tax=Polynucleobacter sp. AP-Reno-20A-A9 TaxID=2576925 RepID=UPI001C0E31E8|nr:hypothetical protein [Polynucleobacter sp. AP-Reno-20A-A9]MBU3628594.1 hypothetical protein [Polynucleobacter sp. AP-Reno-20A-A9]